MSRDNEIISRESEIKLNHTRCPYFSSYEINYKMNEIKHIQLFE